MKKEFDDCYCSFTDNIFIIGNSLVERCICFEDNIPISKYFMNKATNYKWESLGNKKVVLFNVPNFEISQSHISVEILIDDNSGLSNNRLIAKISFTLDEKKVVLSIWIFPKNPFISTILSISGIESANPVSPKQEIFIPDGNENKIDFITENLIIPAVGTIDAIGMCEKHIASKVIELFDTTDKENTLVKEHDDLLYVRKTHKLQGQMFIFDAYLKDESIMLVKESPLPSARLIKDEYDVSIAINKSIEVFGGGVDFSNLEKDEEISLYYSTIGVGKKDNLPAQYKNYYHNMCASIRENGTYSMSNTWGDRNQDAAICENFISKELLFAADIGVNVLQIDDGWQKGTSVNSALSKSGVWGSGYYDCDSDFWLPNTEKFPNGFKAVSDLAEKVGVKLGLWFSPDFINDYVNWQRDANTLLGLWKDYSICYFKLDGIDLSTKNREINLIKMLKTVLKGSNNKITFNFDITAQRRLGYLSLKEIGNIFVENRYTDWGNYYPHTTLRNLWHLSKYFPAGKFQFEFLNLYRNKHKYDDADPLAPSYYETDYAFATTMFSCPLFWMELSNLDIDSKNKLSKLSRVYNDYSKDISKCEITPIGEMPNGISFTGFIAQQNQKSGFLLLFREFCRNDEYEYIIPLLAGKIIDFEITYTNSDDALLSATEKGILFKTSKKSSFIFAKYKLN